MNWKKNYSLHLSKKKILKFNILTSSGSLFSKQSKTVFDHLTVENRIGFDFHQNVYSQSVFDCCFDCSIRCYFSTIKTQYNSRYTAVIKFDKSMILCLILFYWSTFIFAIDYCCRKYFNWRTVDDDLNMLDNAFWHCKSTIPYWRKYFQRDEIHEVHGLVLLVSRNLYNRQQKRKTSHYVRKMLNN